MTLRVYVGLGAQWTIRLLFLYYAMGTLSITANRHSLNLRSCLKNSSYLLHSYALELWYQVMMWPISTVHLQTFVRVFSDMSNFYNLLRKWMCWHAFLLIVSTGGAGPRTGQLRCECLIIWSWKFSPEPIHQWNLVQGLPIFLFTGSFRVEAQYWSLWHTNHYHLRQSFSTVFE